MDDEGMPSVDQHPGPPPDDDDDRYVINLDGLYLRLDGELTRLDAPHQIVELGDRAGVVAIALCELVITRLIKSNCACGGSS